MKKILWHLLLALFIILLSYLIWAFITKEAFPGKGHRRNDGISKI